ncbi:sulfatase [Streptomyces sp. NPDC101219]|uniref:sulfatase n=1 Tax=Streptomyces sp. NPDC101219 TaxID=3366131 RepID=UPI0037FD11CF
MSLFTRPRRLSDAPASGADPDDTPGTTPAPREPRDDHDDHDGDAADTAEPAGSAGATAEAVDGTDPGHEPATGADETKAAGAENTEAAEAKQAGTAGAEETEAAGAREAEAPDEAREAEAPDEGREAEAPDEARETQTADKGREAQTAEAREAQTADEAREASAGKAELEPGGDAATEPDPGAGPAPDPETGQEPAPEADPDPAREADPVPGDAPSAAAVREGWFGWRSRWPRVSRGVTVGTTVLAGALVLFALLVPNRVERLAPEAFLRIPAEGILLAALLLALPPRPRRITAVVTGVLLGLLTVLKFLDMGFHQVLARPFDLVLDWILLDDATDFVRESFGRGGQILAVAGVLVLFVVLLLLMTLATARLARLMARHRPVAARTTLVLCVVWITCVTLGVQVSGVPVATKGTTEMLGNRVEQVRAGIRDARVFKKEAAVDAFADTPPDQLLTGLRGKDVLFTFVESYGRTAIDHPEMAAETDAALTEGTRRLDAAGFGSRSGWLKSPVTGAGSWLAHSTFLSGLWIKNQQRYRSLTTSDRMTLTSYFRRAGDWRTVGIVPGVRRAWPEGKFFGLDHIYDSEHLGYHGPYFSWTPVPDQFSMEAFERLEHGKEDRPPIMAEIILASSHNPWSPIARMIDWEDLGDGSVFHRIKEEGTDPKEVWKSPESIRTEYRRAVEYSLRSLIEWIERYGDEDTVVVFLGDHQPVPAVVDGSPSKEVPVTVVARDKKVLDRIDDWGWTDGLKPAPDAPSWGMDRFRDRFMTAYGPDGGTTGVPGPRD